MYTCIYIYIYTYSWLRSSGMWRLRMRGLKLTVYRSSNTEGVGTPHLKLIWVRFFFLSFCLFSFIVIIIVIIIIKQLVF